MRNRNSLSDPPIQQQARSQQNEEEGKAIIPRRNSPQPEHEEEVKRHVRSDPQENFTLLG
jgi:hypothetical protein